MNLSLLVILCVWFFKEGEFIKKIHKEIFLIPLIVLLILWTIFYFVSEKRAIAFPQWQRMLFSGAAFFTAYRTFPKKYKKNLLTTIIIFGGLMSVYGILQKYGGVWIIRVPQMDRVFGTFGNPNFFASFIIGLIPVSIAFFLMKKSLWKFIAIVAMFWALYYTGTRGAWLGLLGTGIFWWFLWGRKMLPKWATLLLFIIVAVFIFATRNILIRQLDRMLIWRDTLLMTVQNPLFGIGLGEFHGEFSKYASEQMLNVFPRGSFIVNYAHNEFLEVFSETGILGIGIYLWFLVVFYYTAIYKTKKNIIKTGAICGATAILLHSGVSVNMRFAVSSIWAFFLMGLALGWVRKDVIKKNTLNYKKIIAGIGFIFILFLLGQSVIEPLVSHRRLKKAVDFFDKERVYNKDEVKEIIKNDPDNASAYYKLAWLQAKDKEFEKAIKNFRKTIMLDETKVGAFNNLGNIYFIIGRRDLAEKYYKEALKRKPTLTDARFNLGYIYYRSGRIKEAGRQFNKVLEMEPDNYKAKIMLRKMVE